MLHAWKIILLLIIITAFSASALDINEELLEAAKNGQTAEVRALLDAGADVNAKDKYGCTALICAASSRTESNIEILRALLDAGADVNSKDNNSVTALIRASSTRRGINQIKMVQSLLDADADVNAKE